jgi:pyrophosphatase PpaX
MPIDAILFDHDDTLVPTLAPRARAWQEAARRELGLHINGAAYLIEHMGEPIEDSALRLTNGATEPAVRVIATYRDIYFNQDTPDLAPFPGVLDTLAALRARGLPVAVVTSKIHAGAEKELRQCGLAGLIDALVGSDDVTAHKPRPEPLLRAAALLGVEPARALMVGDTPADLLAARAAGTFSAAALWGAHAAGRLLALDPTFALREARDLLDVLGAAAV